MTARNIASDSITSLTASDVEACRKNGDGLRRPKPRDTPNLRNLVHRRVDGAARPHFFIPPIYAEVTEEGRAQAFNNHHLD